MIISNLSIIVAVSENNAIGKDNNLLWHISEDLKHFKEITSGHSVLMGRKTFESLGKKLPNRRNIVITRNPDYTAEGCEMASSLEDAVRLCAGEEEVFVIGGGEIYRQAMDMASKLYLTVVHKVYEADTFFPVIDSSCWKEISREDFFFVAKFEYPYSFIEYCRK